MWRSFERPWMSSIRTLRAISSSSPTTARFWRNEETIATGFVESVVNQIVSKRFAKLQQMQWTKKGAHLVLQTRSQVLDDRLERTFQKWYPGFRPEPQQKAA